MRKTVISVILSVLLCIPAFGDNPSVYAGAAVLIDAHDGTVLFGSNERARMSPASMTKIVTAIIIIQSCSLDEKITITKDDTGAEGSSAYLQEGEVFTVSELLYALLLQSANDAATALANHKGGKDAFAAEMNSFVKELGLSDTQFKNPHGLPEDGHYTTALDMATILCACMSDPVFAKISGCTEYTVKPDETRRGRHFVNHNKLLFTYDGVCGGKTGYTLSSGRCLCSYYSKDGVELCAVTMNDRDDWDDHKKLYDYSRGLYTKTIADISDTFYLHVVSGLSDTVTATVDTKLEIMTRGAYSIEKTVYMRRFEYAPVYEGQSIGVVEYSYRGTVMYTATLYADGTVLPEQNNIRRFFKWKR